MLRLSACALALLCAACGGTGGPAPSDAVQDGPAAIDAAAPPDTVAALDAIADADTAAATDAGDAADTLPARDAASDGGSAPETVADAAADAAVDAGAGDYPPGQPALLPLDGQLLCPARLDGAAAPAWLVVDTGAVRTAVEETLLRDVENGVGVVTLDLGAGVVFPDYAVIAADLATARAYVGHPLAGLIGQDLFARLWFGLDYRAVRVHVAPAAAAPTGPPPGFAAGAARALPYELVQALPVVTVQVGDRAVRLIADTGSGVTLLVASAVPPDLLAAGLAGYVWHTSYGSDAATIVRLPALTVAGLSVRDTWAVVVPDEHHLRAVFTAIGLEVDGFLGYPVYRRFFIEVRGAGQRYDLWPYADLDHVPATEWDRVGVELRRDGPAVVVDMVFAPSDAAAQGVQPEDVLVAVDGAPLAAERPLDEVRLLLRGTPDTVRRLSLERAGAPLTLDVRVDRLLAPETP